jgi:hypothetical protein
MDMEQTSIQIRKRGRPKKTEKISDPKPVKQKLTENMSEYQKKIYIEKKEIKLQSAKECGKRYRDAYKILIKMYNDNISLPDEIKNEIIKIISV